MKIIPIDIPDKTYPHRHYCMMLDNVYLEHKDPIVDRGIGSKWVEVFHNNKCVDLDKKDYEKIGRFDLLYTEPSPHINPDEILDKNIFLLYDPAGLNYAHFFFDLFGRCLYYEELLKINPDIKLGIPEDFYQEKGNSDFIFFVFSENNYFYIFIFKI